MARDEASPVVSLKGLQAPVTVLRDRDGIAHVQAQTERDAYFMQGVLHATDRLFQADLLRRVASGTAAELLGASLLPQDVQLRTLGLRRAAERSLAALSPATRALLDAYADGINAWVSSHPLPAAYGQLQLSHFAPWTALDSVVIGKLFSFQLSFDFDTDLTLSYLSYQRQIAAKFGATGSPGGASSAPQLADALFFLDVFRSAPFDPAATVPDATGATGATGATDAAAAPVAAASMLVVSPASASAPVSPSRPTSDASPASAVGNAAAAGSTDHRLHASTEALMRNWRAQRQGIGLLDRTAQRRQQQIGSNEWAVAGRHTRDGRPLVANDPHLSLGMPANFYDIHLVSRDGLDVIGSSFPGAPAVLQGQNRHIAWGSTTTGFDVTDVFQEQLVPDAASPSGLSSLYLGQREPVIPIPVTFNVNLRAPGGLDQIVPVPAENGIPPVVLVVPRHGPIVQLDSATGAALSIQWAGAEPTRELEFYMRLGRARDLQAFQAALQYFDVGSQHFVYGDVAGNIAYFASGEVPLREDLQAGRLNGAPPWLVRNGQGGNEWLPRPQRGPTDALAFQTLPFAELPQVINPSAGFFVNANNDPAGVSLNNTPLARLRSGGEGIYYLGAYGFDFGLRAARITQLLRERLAKGRVDADDMAAMQADTVLFDAQVFTPMIVRAFDAARRSGAAPLLQQLAADPRVAEAVGRLKRWDHTTPTGLASGFDANDRNGQLGQPKSREIDASVAATIYAVWRGQAIRNVVDRTLQSLEVPLPPDQEAVKALRHLLERDGVGLSTIDFLAWLPLPDAAQRRDAVLLQSLQGALDLLAGPDFAPAFAGSTRQDDYRWGKLHRIVLDAALPEGSIPGSATPAFPPSVAGLPGLAVDGGLGTVDVANHDVRAADAGAFMFRNGPNRRYVAALGARPGAIEARSSLPGGQSGIPGDRFYANLLGRWLTNDSFPLRQDLDDVRRALDERIVFVPRR